MKGPLIFLVSLVAVLGIGAGVLLPVWQEKQDLLGRRSPAPPSPAITAITVEKGLLAAFDPPPERWEDSLAVRLPAAARRAGATADRIRLESGRAQIRLPWDGLPGLLSELASAPIPPVSRLSATPAGDPGWCRVEISFVLSPAAPGTR